MVDVEALNRGYTKSGERCELRRIGPVSVQRVRQLLPFCDTDVVFRNSVDVLSVSRVGRAVPASMQRALEERDPSCRVPGCDVAFGLENHHYVEDYALSKTTRLDGLARVCARHHDMITYQGYVLEGGPGIWRFRGPPDRQRAEELAAAG